MTLGFDTFLVALYTKVSDLYPLHFAACKPRRPGPKPRMSDCEVLTLAICAQWLAHSQRWMLRYAGCHWQVFFPCLLSQSAFNRRSRDLAGVMAAMVPAVAAELQAHSAPYQVIDGMPVPLMRKCRGKKHRLFANEASIGRGGSDRDWYYGCRLLVAVSPTGAVTGFLLGPAGTQERWLAEYLLCWRSDPNSLPWQKEDLPPSNKRNSSDYVGPKGPIWPSSGVGKLSAGPYVADSNFSDAIWIEHWKEDYGASVLTTKEYQGEGADQIKRQHARWRQVVETTFDHLQEVFSLPLPGSRSRWGLLATVAAKLAALNLGILLSRQFGRQDLALATLFVF